jgi:hypothetical protein
MANPPRPAVQRDIFAEADAPSQGFFGLLRMVLFSPRKFFQQLDHNRHAFLAALLILLLLAYSAVQQANPASAPVDSGAVPPMDAGMPPMEGEFPPMDTGAPASTADPSQAWMTGLTAAGQQVIYWAVLTIILSEVSLFNGKAPNFGKNLQIAIWATVPLALMAGVQILYIMGGGTLGKPGFSGAFLDEWEAYATMNPLLQSAIYALASQISIFWFWSLALIYIGAREALKGKRLAILLVLVMWISMLVLAHSYQRYQFLNSQTPEMPGEMMPEGEFPIEGETPLEQIPLEEMPQEEMPPSEGEEAPPPDRSGGKG